jgi:hypothetical protein
MSVIRIRVAASAALVMLFASSCSKSDVDAGVADAAVDSAVTSSSDDARASDTSAPADVDSGSFYDGPAPPPYCVAPCVWEMVKHCVPILDTCIEDVANARETTMCDLQSGWSTRSSGSVNLSGGVGTTTFARNGLSCLTITEYFGPAPAGVVMLRTFDDGAGHHVAVTGAPSPLGRPSTAYCGLTMADVLKLGAADSGTEARPDVTIYTQEPTRPECAAWDANGEPVAAQCRASTRGSCSGHS